MKKNLLLLLTLIYCCCVSYAQVKSISGIVTDSKKNPIPSVSIQIKALKLVTNTDNKGHFSILTSAANVRATFSYIGFKTIEIELTNGLPANVVLEESKNQLEEIVVVGYGTVAKKDLTGSIGTLSGQKVAERHNTNVTQALQGAVPGLTVSRSTTQPGAGGTIRIRGITTLGAGNDPLVIINGVPGDINNVNPVDIENISVLKDAASAAIYGSRAASGVILISTKRAKNGQAQITYSSNFGIQKPVSTPKFVDGATYMRLANQILINDGRTPLYETALIDNYANLHAADPDKYPDENWGDLYYKKSAPQQRHNLDLTVGTDKLKSKILMGYDDQKGLDRNRDFNRITLRANNDLNINKMLSASVDLSYIRAEANSSSVVDPSSARFIPPIYDSYYDDGRFAPARDGNNPIAQNELGGRMKGVNHQLNARIQFNFTPFEGFKLSGIVAPQLAFSKNNVTNKIVNFYSKTDPSLVINRFGTTNSLSESNKNDQSINTQLLANYTTTIANNHKLTALLGYEENTFRTDTSSLFRDGYVLPDYEVIDAGGIANVRNSGTAYENALRSYFSRIDYSYKGKYLLGISGRYDGSSRFAKKNRWGFFPSISAGWIISEENFAKRLPFDFLKLRGSWGRNGNQNIGNYSYLSLISLGTTLMYNSSGGIVSVPTGNQSDINIDDKSWETKEDYNVGVDMALIHKKLSISADYFVKNTFDILINQDIPLNIGLASTTTNAASMENRGWEFQASWSDKIGSDWSYSVSANISDFKNKVTDTKGINILANNARIEGQPFNVYYGYKSAGYFQSDADVAASAKLTGTEKPGDLKFVDINGDGKIDAANDRVVLGDPYPHYTYGGFASVRYKNIDLGFSFQGIGKQNRRPDDLMINPTVASGSFNIQEYMNGNTWTPQNPNARYPRLTSANATVNYSTLTNFYLFNGSYFRLKDINIGYTFNADAISRIGFKNARIFVSGTDVLSFKNKGFQPGWDPEDAQGTSPLIATYLVGISLTF
jgi:TonB-linked SusC/RagA family outer membrane protein